MRRAVLVSHRPPHHPGGAAARWRSLVPALAERGWQMEVVASETVDDLAATRDQRADVERRARIIARIRPLARLPFGLLRLEPPPRSTLWAVRGARLTRRRLKEHPEVLVVTGPPMVALLAARLALIGSDVPFVVELRDLWAGNPMYDRGSALLARLERWILARAQQIVVCTEEALADVRARHPGLAARCRVVPNGFEPALLDRRRPPGPAHARRTVLHSGVLSEQRPMAPVLEILGEPAFRDAFRVVLHGFLAPEIRRQVADAPDGVAIEIVAPSSWDDAVQRIAECDVALLTQGRAAGDATAVASKVYEYLALGKPVLCITDGGATEGVLKRLGAGRYCGRLDDPDSIRAAFSRVLEDGPPAPLPAGALAPYSRATIADGMAVLLTQVAAEPR